MKGLVIGDLTRVRCCVRGQQAPRRIPPHLYSRPGISGNGLIDNVKFNRSVVARSIPTDALKYI